MPEQGCRDRVFARLRNLGENSFRKEQRPQ